MRVWASRYARLVLERAKGNKREACRVLDISYHTLQAHLRTAIDAAAQQADWSATERTDVPRAPDETTECDTPVGV